MRGHAKFLGGLKNRGGKAFRGLLQRGVWIASVTSYLHENGAENLQNGDVHLAQIPDFGMGYLDNHLAH